jgi:hypothetical protein
MPRFYNVRDVRHGDTPLPTVQAVELNAAGGILRVGPGQREWTGSVDVASYVPWRTLHLPGVESLIAAGLIVAGIRRPLPDPLPLFANVAGKRLAGLAVPLDLWDWYNGQPLAQVELIPAVLGGLHPADAPGNGILDRGEVWIDPVTGATLARLTDEEMEPVTEAGDAITGESA